MNSLKGYALVAKGENWKIWAIKLTTKDGEIHLRLYIEKNGVLAHKPLDISPDKLESKIFKINNYGLMFESAQIYSISDSLQENFDCFNVIPYKKGIGFQRDKEGNIDGYACSKVLDRHGSEVLQDEEDLAIRTRGTAKEYQEAIENYIRGNIVRQILFLASISAVFCGILKRNLLMGIIAKSSHGKSTVGKLFEAAFVTQDNTILNKNFGATINYLIKSMGNIFGAGVLLDDASLSKLKDFSSLIYELAQGEEKGRLIKGSVLDEKATWNTSILMTAENSILETCNPLQEGVVGRLIEIRINNNELFNSEEECEKIQDIYKQQYGTFALELVAYILRKELINKSEGMYKEELRLIRISTKEDEDIDRVLKRLQESTALIRLTGRVLKDAFGMDFNFEAITEFLNKNNKENLEAYRQRHPFKRIIEELYEPIIEYGKTYFPEFIRDEGVWIPSRGFKEFITGQTKEFKAIHVKKALDEAGLLVTNIGNGFNITHKGNSLTGVCIAINKELIQGDEM